MVINGMCTDSVGGLIGVQCREYSVLDFHDDLRADGLLCSALMIEEVGAYGSACRRGCGAFAVMTAEIVIR